ncbi:hypothetical protein O181_095616 [Austropuccinia psidii MF-1]|uniref:Nudix hydrolase domain-containing protein n=1 Tax=Austropuccinia psidii MF-1 TaxID=1389203 RepID=A0A9Q3J5T3_9BASI|nr:hypothetical protein [Austropuccinia psidii MF-1]
MSEFLKILISCQNFNLSKSIHHHPSIDPSIDSSKDSSKEPSRNHLVEHLVPFFIHAPDHSDHSIVIRPQPTSPKLPSRRTSSSSSRRQSANKILKPLSLYLTKSNSDDQLNLACFQSQSFLSNSNSNSNYDDHEKIRDFSQPIGYLRPCIINALFNDNQKMLEIKTKPCWKFLYSIHQNSNHPIISDTDHQSLLSPWAIAFEDWINDSENRLETRREHLDRLIRNWKQSGLFLDQLSGWRDEEYSVYGPKLYNDLNHLSNLPGSNEAFRIERAAVGLFSFLSFGAHLTAYIKKDDQYYFWIPRRSATKATWPSKLDNTVAGGIPAGESPLETILRESFEEASLDQDFVRSNVRPCGLISYVHRNQFGWISPEIQYTYDLELPFDQSIIPKPNDGESENFKLFTLEELKSSLIEEKFKPNCAGVLIDFLIRHGIFNFENQPSFAQMCTILKQSIDLPLP